MPTDTAGGWWEEKTISKHLRVAAGACALSAGLVIGSGGGAIAVADTETGASTSTTQGSTGTHSWSRGPISTLADSLRKAVENSLHGALRGVTGTVNSHSNASQLPSNIPESPQTTFGGTPTVYGSTVSVGPTPEDPIASESEAPAAVDTPATPIAAEPIAAEPIAAEPIAAEPIAASTNTALPTTATNTTATNTTSTNTTSTNTTSTNTALPTTAPSVPAYVAPNPIFAATNVIAPITNSFLSLATTLGTAPALLLALPTSTTPVADVLTYFQAVVAAVGQAGSSLAQLPTDLAGLFGIHPTATPAAPIGASAGLLGLRAATYAPFAAPGWSALPQLLFVPSVDAGSAAGPLPGPVVPLDATTTPAASSASASGSASVVSKADGTNDVLSTVQHVIGAFVATVSLTALAAVALPGLIALLSTCAAGIRVGYRQAKAGAQLPDTAISRFVGSGPVGVVRSGAQVQMRMRASRLIRNCPRAEVPTRALHVVHSETSSAHLLDQAV